MTNVYLCAIAGTSSTKKKGGDTLNTSPALSLNHDVNFSHLRLTIAVMTLAKIIRGQKKLLHA